VTQKNSRVGKFQKGGNSSKGQNVKNRFKNNFWEDKKMQQRKLYLWGLLIILFFGSSVALWADSGVCPIHPTADKAILDLPQEEVLTAGENLAAVRSQVLLEVFGRTT
jgi:hypothetical protein